MASETKQKGRIFTGARARLKISGVTVGYATQVTVTEEVQYDPAEVVDNIETEEFVPVAYRVSGSCNTLRVVGETWKSQNWFPKNGIDTNAHLLNILATGDDVTLTLEDAKTQKTVALVEQVKFGRRNLSVGARGISGEDIDFVAIRVKDESET
jgi:hypothetical protein